MRICAGYLGLAAALTATQPATDGTVLSDLQNLVRAHVRIGAVLGRSIRLHTDPPHPGVPLDSPDRSGAAAQIAARWRGAFTVTAGPVLRLRSEDSATCQASLAQRVDAESIHGNATEMRFALEQGVDPSLAGLPPPGLLQGGGDRVASGDRIHRDRARLTGGRISVESALDQLVTRLPGYGWWASETCPKPGRCVCAIGLVTADGAVFAGHDITPPALERDPAR
jgi:hypothetical protein